MTTILGSPTGGLSRADLSYITAPYGAAITKADDDSTVLLQYANLAKALGRGVQLRATDSYRLRSPLAWPDGVPLKGQGSAVTQIVCNANGYLKFNDPVGPTAFIYSYVGGFLIKGANVAQELIRIGYVLATQFDDIRAFSAAAGKSAILIQTTQGCRFTNWYVSANAGDNVTMDLGAANNTFISCYIRDAGNRNLVFTASQLTAPPNTSGSDVPLNNYIFGGGIEGATNGSIKIDCGRGINFFGVETSSSGAPVNPTFWMGPVTGAFPTADQNSVTFFGGQLKGGDSGGSGPGVACRVETGTLTLGGGVYLRSADVGVEYGDSAAVRWRGHIPNGLTRESAMMAGATQTVDKVSSHNGTVHKFAVQTTINNSTAFVDVPGLSFTAVPFGIYRGFLDLVAQGDPGADIKFRFQGPGGYAIEWDCTSQALTFAAPPAAPNFNWFDNTGVGQAGVLMGTNFKVARIVFVVRMGATAAIAVNPVKFQCAQNVASIIDTVVSTSSRIEVARVG